MERLASMSGSVERDFCRTSNVWSVPPCHTPVLRASSSDPKATALTASDVHKLPHLDGSPDVDVAAVLSRYRLVAGFKAKTARPTTRSTPTSLHLSTFRVFATGLSSHSTSSSF